MVTWQDRLTSISLQIELLGLHSITDQIKNRADGSIFTNQKNIGLYQMIDYDF